MPALQDFGSCQIRMYFKDHNPPHVHVVSPDETALVRIEDGAVIEGEIAAASLKRRGHGSKSTKPSCSRSGKIFKSDALLKGAGLK